MRKFSFLHTSFKFTTALHPSGSSCTLTHRNTSDKDMLCTHLLTPEAQASETHTHHGTMLSHRCTNIQIHLLAPHKCRSTYVHTNTQTCAHQRIYQMQLPLTKSLRRGYAIVSQLLMDCRLSSWQSWIWPRLDSESWRIKDTDQTVRHTGWSKGPQDKVVINRSIHPPLPSPHHKSPELSSWERSTSLC